MNKFYAIRGATTAKNNSADSIKEASVELINAILSQNSLQLDNLVSIIASVTADITADNPVKFMRQGVLGDTPVFCVQEAEIDGGLPLCIRVLAHIQTQKQDFKVKHVYLNGAKVLRPDLVKNEESQK